MVAQEVTPVWLQHVNGVVNILPENKLPILAKAGGTGDNTYGFSGKDVIDSYAGFMKYDDSLYLLGIRENGINEDDPSLTQEQKDKAAKYPDRSLIWIDAATGKPLGLALKTEVLPVPLATQAATHAWWKWGITDGPHGERVIYTGYKYKILRYAAAGLVDDANFPNKRATWSTTPTEAWVEPVEGEPNPTIVPGEQGTEPGESNGDGSASWRWKAFRVTGFGPTLRIVAGGGTWRSSMQPQEFVSDNGGLTLRPIARVDERNNGGAKGSYALGGQPSSVRYDVNDSTAAGSGWVIETHYPGSGWEARPNRYIKNPSETLPDGSANEFTNRFRQVDAATGALPAFRWEAAGKDGIPLKHAVDGVEYYDGNWVLTSDTKEGRDYIVTYAIPSWNQQFGSVGAAGAVFKPAWIGVHTLDGMIASGASAYKVPVYETDEPIVDPNGNGGTGHDYGYDGDVYIYPDTTAAATSGKAIVLWAGGSYGFGVFKVENTAAQIVTAPVPTEALENTKVSLTAVVTGSPNKYQWYKDGTALNPTNQAFAANLFEGANKAILTLLDAKAADSGNYQLKVTNPLGNVETTPVKLTIVSDTTPPTVASAVSQTTPSSHLLQVTFSERVDTNTAVEATRYTINGLAVQAVLAADETTVSVKTAVPTPGQEYTLTVTGVKDLAGNATTSSTKAVFKAGTLTAGYVLWEFFPGTPGTAVADAYNDSNFPDHATRSTLVTSFTTSPTLDNYAENFAGRMSGWLTPTEGGQYRFFIKSDDASELFLSTDDTLANAVSIATETGCCQPFQDPTVEPAPTQTSAPISLVAGKKYLLYAIYKEGGGGDNCSVAWRKEGDATPAANLQPIPGSLLSSFRSAPAEAGTFQTTTLSAGQVNITWTGAGVLQESSDLKTWTDVSGNPASPYKVTPEVGARFYRLKN